MKKQTSFGDAITSYIPEIVELLVTALIVALTDIFFPTDANTRACFKSHNQSKIEPI